MRLVATALVLAIVVVLVLAGVMIIATGRRRGGDADG